jgi:hypothetical protein
MFDNLPSLSTTSAPMDITPETELDHYLSTKADPTVADPLAW